MGKTNIEWTRGDDGSAGSTWNCLRGCSRISPGCQQCYAEKIAARFSEPGQPFHGFAERTSSGGRWTGKVELISDKLTEPLTWWKPRRVFVNSMSDVFHESLSFEDIDQIFGVMHACEYLRSPRSRSDVVSPGHTFQLLTKRAERMREYLSTDRREKWACAGAPHCEEADLVFDQIAFRTDLHPRIWLGVSVEDRKYGVPRLDHLRNVPAAVRFVSFEPLLEDLGVLDLRGIGWCIVGGESGGKSRPCNTGWIRSIVEQCREVRTPAFVKQLGSKPVGKDFGPPGPAHRFDSLITWNGSLVDKKGGDINEFPVDLRVRQFPEEARP